MANFPWTEPKEFSPVAYRCGHCGDKVASHRGYRSAIADHFLVICPGCSHPTYFAGPTRFPDSKFGEDVGYLPTDVSSLYDEARRDVSVSGFTSAVMLCRKLLMHLAVTHGADQGKSFLEYVEYLASKGYVPPGGKEWVDHIRNKGNEANHEIKIMAREEAELLLTFVGMLLKFMYEFPAKVPRPQTSVAAP